MWNPSRSFLYFCFSSAVSVASDRVIAEAKSVLSGVRCKTPDRDHFTGPGGCGVASATATFKSAPSHRWSRIVGQKSQTAPPGGAKRAGLQSGYPGVSAIKNLGFQEFAPWTSHAP